MSCARLCFLGCVQGHSQGSRSFIIRDLRGHLLHTVTFLLFSFFFFFLMGGGGQYVGWWELFIYLLFLSFFFFFFFSFNFFLIFMIFFYFLVYLFFSFFIRPFEKRSYYVIPLGVRPSVRPSICKLFRFRVTPPTVYVRLS